MEQLLGLAVAIFSLGKIHGTAGAWQKGALLHAEELVQEGEEDAVIAQLEENAYNQEVKENTPQKITKFPYRACNDCKADGEQTPIMDRIHGVQPMRLQ